MSLFRNLSKKRFGFLDSCGFKIFKCRQSREGGRERERAREGERGGERGREGERGKRNIHFLTAVKTEYRLNN